MHCLNFSSVFFFVVLGAQACVGGSTSAAAEPRELLCDGKNSCVDLILTHYKSILFLGAGACQNVRAYDADQVICNPYEACENCDFFTDLQGMIYIKTEIFTFQRKLDCK